LSTSQKTALANYIALMTELIVELSMIVLYEVDFNSITRADAAGQSPVTLVSYEAIKSMILDGHHIQWVPEICFRIKDVFMERLQMFGSNPGVDQLPVYFYPVTYRNLSVAGIYARIDLLNTYTSGFFQANEIKVIGRALTWDDVLPREALPGDSSYGVFIRAVTPVLVDNGGAETVATTTCLTTTAAIWNQAIGIGSFWDIAALFCTDDAGRANNDWEVLTVQSVGNNLCSLSAYAPDATSFTVLGEATTELRWLQCGASACVTAGSGTLEWGAQYEPYWNYRIIVTTEAHWNLLMNGSIYQMLSGAGYVSSLQWHKLLPTIRTVEEGERLRGSGGPGTRQRSSAWVKPGDKNPATGRVLNESEANQYNEQQGL
jgi:hypothetical protein